MKNQSDLNPLDDQLAEFTDRLLAGLELVGMEAAILQERELRQYQEVVLRMKQVRGSGKPSPEIASRIRANLISEWNKAGMSVPQKANPTRTHSALPTQPRRSFWRSSSKRQIFALRLAAAAFTALLLALVVFKPTGESIPGAAGGTTNLLPTVLALGIMTTVAFIWYWWRQKH